MIWVWWLILGYIAATLYKWALPNHWLDLSKPWDPRDGRPRSGKDDDA